MPSYIKEPTGDNEHACKDNPYYVDADSAINYGTLDTSPAWMYPCRATATSPATTPKHQGGDTWVTNAAFDIMDHETDWSGMLLTYGGIDKAGHMWGGLNDVPPYATADPSSHMAAMAKVADDQVGRVIARLKADGLLDETLVVLTTDHAQNTAVNYFGDDGRNRGNFNWYYGSDADETYQQPAAEIQKLIAGTHENVAMSMQDSAIRTWLRTNDASAEGAGRRRDGDPRRRPCGRTSATATTTSSAGRHPARSGAPSECAWYQKHGQEIVDTQAAPYGPDVIGLLADDTSYGVKGDHGGAQESVQRIPIVFYGAGVKAGRRRGPRCVRWTSPRPSCVSSGSARRRRRTGWPTRCPDPRARATARRTQRGPVADATGPLDGLGSDVEPVEVHDLDPRRDEVVRRTSSARRRWRRPRRARAARSSSRRRGRRGCRST